MRKTIVICAVLCALAGAARAQKVEIIMATLAPTDSEWYKVMENMGAEWKRISGGNVILSIRAGGVVGDDPDAVRRLRSGSIQAAALTSAGLGDIDLGVAALQIPMMFDNYAELDYVRDRMAPKLEKRIEDKGYLVLNWGDAGWVQFFSTKPVHRLDDLRKLKLFTWAGYPTEEDLWKANGFRVVPLASTDIVQQLETHGIEAVPTTALYRGDGPALQAGRIYVRRQVGALARSDRRLEGHLGEDPGRTARPHAGRRAQIRGGPEERYPRAGYTGPPGHDEGPAGQALQHTHHHNPRSGCPRRMASADRGHLPQDERQDGAGRLV
jgi:hypothetical protein